MKQLDIILRDTYSDFLRESSFFSYMNGESYQTIIQKEIAEGNCHILSKVLQNRLKNTLIGYDDVSVDIIGPSISHNGSLYPEYQYHTAVLVRHHTYNTIHLLDPGSFFVDPVLLKPERNEYHYSCLDSKRKTLLSVDNKNITHTTQHLQKTLMVTLDMQSLDDDQIQKLFEDHQIYEKNRHNLKKSQRKFVYHTENKSFVIDKK